MKYLLLLAVSLYLPSSAFAKSEVVGDYHVQTYQDGLGYISDVELFTKVPDKKAYFGITCSAMSALPMVQIILFDDQILAESPKLTEVVYQIGNQPGKQIFNGVLKVTDTADELSNKLVLDVQKVGISSLQQIKGRYQSFFEELSADEQPLEFEIKHRSFKDRKYVFSLKGFKAVLNKYQSICI